MATHNPKESRRTCESTLAYMYRGDRHEHQVGTVIHLGGNILAENPIKSIDAETIIDLDEIAAELNYQASLHRGKGEELFKHYVISLSPNEELKDYQWSELINSYMYALGYDSSTKWTAVEHRDSIARHVHILACRVRNDHGGSLVSTYNDYERGWPIMREFETKFGLRKVENPADSFGKNKSKAQIKSDLKSINSKSQDDAVRIRAAFKMLYSEIGKPKTMRDLVVGLSKCGVNVKVAFDKNGSINGINYKMKDGKNWISGSKVKSTRFTWTALQKKEGINYNPNRDDVFLMPQEGVIEISLRVDKKPDYYSFTSYIIEQEKQRIVLAKFRAKKFTDLENMKELIEIIMVLLNVIFKILFGIFGIRIDLNDCEYSYSSTPETNNTWSTLQKQMPVLENDALSQEETSTLTTSELWLNPQIETGLLGTPSNSKASKAQELRENEHSNFEM